MSQPAFWAILLSARRRARFCPLRRPEIMIVGTEFSRSLLATIHRAWPAMISQVSSIRIGLMTPMATTAASSCSNCRLECVRAWSL